MTALNVQVDKRQLRAVERTLAAIPGALGRVVPRAVNKVATYARTRVVRSVTSKIVLRTLDVRRAVTLRRANRRTWEARISVRGDRIPLGKFSPSMTRRGVTYRIQRTGARQRIPTAFLAKMKCGPTLVAQRRTILGRRVGRLPINELFGPSVPAVVEGIGEFASGELERAVAQRLEREVATQTGLELERAARRAGRAG